MLKCVAPAANQGIKKESGADILVTGSAPGTRT